MLVKPFAHGKGSGDAAVNYLLRMDYHGREEHPPNILRGDPEMTKELINSIDRDWKFTAGVCSWSGKDTVTPEQETEVIAKFEKLAFAGLEPDQYNILWVRHSHANHHELHFVIPRIELSTGNAFNAFPPGWEKDFGHFRDYMNIKHDWTRPNDPERKRMFTPSNADIVEARLTRWGQNPTKQEKDKIRKLINDYIKGQIENGVINNRSDITTALLEVGLEINREGKDYLTVKDPESTEKIRLKGGVYDAEWKSEDLTGTTKAEGHKRTAKDRGDLQRELSDLEKQLAGVFKKRANYNRTRYKNSGYGVVKGSETVLPDIQQNIQKKNDPNLHTWSCTHNRDVSSVLGSDGRSCITAQVDTDRAENSSKQDKRTVSDIGNTSERHLRDTSNSQRRWSLHSDSREVQNRDQVVVQKSRSDQTDSKELINIQELLNAENNSINSMSKGQNHGNERTGNNCNGDNNFTGNRHSSKHREMEGIRKFENFRFGEAILGSLRTIRKIRSITDTIKWSFRKIKGCQPLDRQSITLKSTQKSKNNGIEL